MIQAKSVHHIGIAVKSIAEQRPFYEVVLGGVFEGVEESWLGKGHHGQASAAAVEASGLLADVDWNRPPRSKKPLAIGALVAVALGGLLLAPMPHTATAPITLVPRSLTPVTLVRGGTFSAISVTEGQWAVTYAPDAGLVDRALVGPCCCRHG